MNAKDRSLGMHRGITRRDVLQSVGAFAASTFVPGKLAADELLAAAPGGQLIYPPALTGLRGSHVGSFEVAHQLAREGRTGWGPVKESDSGIYDLVVVGAGISGLSAAHFYLKSNPDARILILDNHDDFGGHAKRNEFQVSGRNILAYGGAQTLEEPSSYPAVAQQLLNDIGVDLDSFYDTYDRQFFQRHGLGGATFFNRNDWGTDKLVQYDLGGLRFTSPLVRDQISVEDAVQQMPMSEAARREMLRLLTTRDDKLADLSADEKEALLFSISYRDFLSKYLGITEPEVFAALQDLTTDSGADFSAVPAIGAIAYSGLPGIEAAGLGDLDGSEPYIHHYPDGNASIARQLVRRMIPAVAAGSTMQDIVLAQFDYSKLDQPDSQVRMRLNSTVVNVHHNGKAAGADSVTLSYVRDGRLGEVRARHCVMACYNAMIPSICPELPEAQRAALSQSFKVPILYTNVALNNWRAWHKLGVGAVSAPGCYHVNAMLDFPVNMGDYQFANGPDDPVVIHMERFPHGAKAGLTKRQQAQLGRHELLSTSFETIERSIREQLATMLAGGGFDPARDIEGITVNRWPHGYATRDWLEDPYYDDEEHYAFVKGRKPYGRITIANSDAGASATFDEAVVQAYRAVNELS